MRRFKNFAFLFLSAERRKVSGLGLSLLGVCLVLISCAPNRCLQVCSPDQEEAINFGGIARDVSGTKVKVLIVHGIGQQDPTVSADGVISNLYSSDLIAGLQGELGLQPVPCSGDDCKAFVIPGDPQDGCVKEAASHPEGGIVCGKYGFVQKSSFISPKKVSYAFYTFYWSPLSSPFKEYLLGYDKKHWKYREHYNKILKETLLDESISDAVLFAGSFRVHLKYSVRQAMCYVLTNQKCPENNADLGAENAPVYVISHSLGSRMVFDELMAENEPADPAKPAAALKPTESLKPAESFASHLAGVFMLANQLPLLELADQTDTFDHNRPRKSSSPLSKGVNRWIDARMKRTHSSLEPSAASETAPALPVVAFSDPNDLLSYALPPNWRRTLLGETQNASTISFVNVLLKNQAFDIRAVIDDPNKAHIGYWRNPVVWNLIVHGYSGVRQRCYAPLSDMPELLNTTCSGQAGQRKAAFLSD